MLICEHWTDQPTEAKGTTVSGRGLKILVQALTEKGHHPNMEGDNSKWMEISYFQLMRTENDTSQPAISEKKRNVPTGKPGCFEKILTVACSLHHHYIFVSFHPPFIASCAATGDYVWGPEPLKFGESIKESSNQLANSLICP